jgi:hypothetical protein
MPHLAERQSACLGDQASVLYGSVSLERFAAETRPQADAGQANTPRAPLIRC